MAEIVKKKWSESFKNMGLPAPIETKFAALAEDLEKLVPDSDYKAQIIRELMETARWVVKSK